MSEKLNRMNLRKVKEVAETYARVFAGDEWKEVTCGPVCGKFYGPETRPGEICPCGCGKLEEAYPRVKTTRYILNETSSSDSIAIIEEEDGKPKGFGWGFRLSGKDFAKKKYNTEEGKKTVEELVGTDAEYFYISEVGVAPEKQGQNLGGQITRKLAEEGKKKGLSLLLRTIKTSTMKYSAQNMGMVAIMGIEGTPKDPENPDRLLFIKRK